MTAVLLVDFPRIVFRHEADGAGVHVQSIHMVLREEADSESGMLGDETLGWLELTDEQFQHGGFAGAVGADDADSGVELDVQIHASQEKGVGCVAKRHAAHLDDWRGEFLDFGEFEVHNVFVFGGLEYGHLFQFLDSGLGFGGFGGVVAELVNEDL